MLVNAPCVFVVSPGQTAGPETQLLPAERLIQRLQHDFGDPLHGGSAVHRSALEHGVATGLARHQGSEMILPIVLACARRTSRIPRNMRRDPLVASVRTGCIRG